MSFDLTSLVRRNIRNLKPYSSARQEFSGQAQIFLDANENSFGSPLPVNYSRYPDPGQSAIKNVITKRQNISPGEIFAGHGSDEAIDLLLRIFCEPRRDNVLICPPTYGMYEVSAAVNDIEVIKVNLTEDFQLDLPAIKSAINRQTKIIFICSPNNPTGNTLRRDDILSMVGEFQGIVVVDEAYIHFSQERSLIREINNFPNLVVLQTFSKAWGLAGLRVGLAFANEQIIDFFNKVKLPYNISEIVQQEILKALENESEVKENIDKILGERENLVNNLKELPLVKKVYPTDANFILVKMTDANRIYNFLIEKMIVVRNRHQVELCEDCLRITIGNTDENNRLLESLRRFTEQATEQTTQEAAE